MFYNTLPGNRQKVNVIENLSVRILVEDIQLCLKYSIKMK